MFITVFKHALVLILTTAFNWGYNLDTSHPIIYGNPNERDKLTYFGYSVSIRPGASTQNGSWAIQIGAPRSNVSGVPVKEPGAVYRCGIYGPCLLHVVEKTGNVPGKDGPYNYMDKKDEAWVGVSMDIKNTTIGETTVICGHRWSNQNLKNPENIAVTYLMTGVCYLQDNSGDNAAHKLLPLINQDKIYSPRPYIYLQSIYYWGLGQAGMAVQMTENEVLIGAPGVNNWMGSVIRYRISDKYTEVGRFEQSGVMRRDRYSYIGYQVSTGRFFGDKKTWHVAGAPRSADYHGRVLLFQFKGRNGEVQIISNLTGSTFGEYFGSSLTVTDINNDGLDDLVVGAPLYSKKYPEEGRIYTYLGSTRSGLLVQSQIINGRIALGRFGTSIATFGDLDNDGYRDVAVGAPFENDNRGAVYIYKGTAKGLQNEYIQRIFAEDLHSSLRGFGATISQGIDIDGNSYPDVLIGAYLSDQAVLLRSRPVVLLHPTIDHLHLPLLDRLLLSFNITVCSRYSGNAVPSSINVTRVIQLDPRYGRAVFKSSGSSIEKRLVRLSFNENYCETIPVNLNPKATNNSYSNALPVILRNELPSCSPTGSSALLVRAQQINKLDRFSKWCPIGDSKETLVEVPFAGECGSDGICKSDLSLTCTVLEVQKSLYLIGSSEYLTLAIEMVNTGEPAHNVKLTASSNMDLIQDERQAWDESEDSEYSLSLDVDTVLSRSVQQPFLLRVNLDPVISRGFQKDDIFFRVNVTTTSQEREINNNVCDLSLRLVSDVVVDLSSSTSAETVSVSKSDNRLVNFTHTYEIQNKGKTPAYNAELSIYVPSIYIKERELQLSIVEVETPDWMTQFATRYETTMNSEVDDVMVEVVPNTADNSKHYPPTNRTTFVNCTSPNVKCNSLDFTFPEGIPDEVSSVVKIFVTVNFSNLEELTEKEMDIFYYTTNAVLKVPKLCATVTLALSSNTSVSIFEESSEAAQVDAYIIALSVLGGGLLLSLIISGLVKKKFFRRKRKEELKALKTDMQRLSGFDLVQPDGEDNGDSQGQTQTNIFR